MKRIHIIGGKNHGKTTLVAELVRELTAQGLRVGAIKHTSHRHELDTPGKDSFRHREAGAAVVGILSRSMNAVFWPPQEPSAGDGASETAPGETADARYDDFAKMFADCDLVVVEGDTKTTGRKIEVWRAALDTPPMAASDGSIFAVITDDPLEIDKPLWPRSDIGLIAGQVRSLVSGEA